MPKLPAQTPERRKFPRVALSVAALIKGRNDIGAGFVDNMSLSGLYMRLQNPVSLAEDEPITVDIYLAESETSSSILTLPGRVTRLDERGLAVQFRPMTVASHSRLRAIIAFVTAEQTSSDDEAFLQFQLSLLKS